MDHFVKPDEPEKAHNDGNHANDSGPELDSFGIESALPIKIRNNEDDLEEEMQGESGGKKQQEAAKDVNLERCYHECDYNVLHDDPLRPQEILSVTSEER